MKRYIGNIPGISPGLLRPVRDPARLPAWLPAKKSLLLPCGRNALYLGYKAMGLKKGDQVLMPAFVCKTVSRPLQKAGANLVFFNVNGDFTIDWEHLYKVMNPKVRALLWYHYLGNSFYMDEFMRFCAENRIYFIEDCAHALFALHRGRPVGSYGDFSIYSIRKSIPTLFSAAMVVNNPGFKVRAVKMEPPQNALRSYILERECYLYQLYLQSLDSKKKVERLPYSYYAAGIERHYKNDAALHAMDEVSQLVMHNVDPAAVRAARARNYRQYLAALGELCPFGAMTPGAAPIGFPVIVKNRDRLQKRLAKEGIETLIHWYRGLLPPGAAAKFEGARRLSDTLLSLPCHHGLGPREIGHVCTTIKRLYSGGAS